MNLPDSMPRCSSAMVVSSSSNLGTWAGWLTGRAEARKGANAAAMPVTALACKRPRRDSLFDRMIPRTLAQGLAWLSLRRVDCKHERGGLPMMQW